MLEEYHEPYNIFYVWLMIAFKKVEFPVLRFCRVTYVHRHIYCTTTPFLPILFIVGKHVPVITVVSSGAPEASALPSLHVWYFSYSFYYKFIVLVIWALDINFFRMYKTKNNYNIHCFDGV